MYNLTLKQLKTIYILAETNRLVNAAELLSLTPPAVTIQLKLAEEQIGLKLFHRTQTGLKLTDAGKEVVSSARKIFGHLNDMQNKLESISNSKTGSVKIGVVATAKYFAHKIIAGFITLNPDIKVSINVNSREIILNEIEAYNLDLAITGTIPLGYDLTTKPFGKHPIIMICKPGHHLTKKKSFSKKELIGEIFLTRETGSGTYNLLQSFLEEIKLETEPSLIFSGTNETVKQAVIAGLGIALISKHCCFNELQNNLLQEIKVEGLPIMKEWYITQLKNRTLTPSSKLLFDFIEQNGNSYLPI